MTVLPEPYGHSCLNHQEVEYGQDGFFHDVILDSLLLSSDHLFGILHTSIYLLEERADRPGQRLSLSQRQVCGEKVLSEDAAQSNQLKHYLSYWSIWDAFVLSQ